jgi:hypothetical protein
MLGTLMQVVNDSVLVPFVSSAPFRSGFLSAIVIGALLQLVFRIVQHTWKAINLLFAPSKEPATKPGKSPFNVMSGCAMTAMAWGLGILLVVAWLRMP